MGTFHELWQWHLTGIIQGIASSFVCMIPAPIILGNWFKKKTGMGIIFITHNLGVVADICDKVSVMYAGKIVEQGPVDDIFYEPAHPYTKGLLRSMPRVDAKSYERLIPIEGTPVDMLNPPEGCPFAPRCEHCMKICLKKMPPYVEVGEKHRSACWLRVQELMNKEEK